MEDARCNTILEHYRKRGELGLQPNAQLHHTSVTKRESLYNTHFVRIFSVLPQMGNSPIQLHLLQRC